MRRLDDAIEWVSGSDAATEAGSERDGFLSYSSEWHTTAYGLGLGFSAIAAVAGQPWILQITIAALGGIGAKRVFKDERVTREIRDEPQYFLPSIVVGAVIGAQVFGVLEVLALLP